MSDGYFKEEAIAHYDFMTAQQVAHEQETFSKLVTAAMLTFQIEPEVVETITITDSRPVIAPIFEFYDEKSKLKMSVNLEYDTNLYVSLRLFK